MPEDRLEQVMLQFMAQEFDILVCTVIIESGIDIPNVNTIIIDDAHNLGLAQLYQLRGRGGKNEQGWPMHTFCSSGMQPSAKLQRRGWLQFGSLRAWGSGYKIAMRDLEIRGAGNILGPEQHGHIGGGSDLKCTAGSWKRP